MNLRYTQSLCAAILLLLTVLPFADKLMASDRKAISEDDRVKAEYIFLEAEKQRNMGRDDAFHHLLQYAHSLDPENSAIAYYLGYSRLMKSNLSVSDSLFSSSLRMMRKHVDAHPEDKYEAMLYANGNMIANQVQEGLRVLKIQAERNPHNVEVQLSIADAYARLEDYRNAIAAYDSVQQWQGQSVQLSARKVRAYQALNDTVGAIGEMRSLLATAPRNVDYNLAMGNMMLMFGERDSALTYYDKAQQYEPENGATYLAKAQFYNAIGDSVNYDQQTYQALVSKDLDVASKVEVLADYARHLLVEKDSSARTENLFKVLIEQHPNEPQIRMLFSDYLAAKDDMKGAAEQMDYAVNLDPTDAQAWNRLLVLNIISENYEAAIAAGDRAIELNPNDIELYGYIAPAYYNIKQYDKAIEVYKKALAAVDSTDTEHRSMFLGGMGDAKFSMGDTIGAFALYDQAIEIDPNNVSILNNYAYFLTLCNRDLDKAERMSAKTVQAEPQNATFLDTYAWVFYKRKEYTMAQLYIEMAIKNERRPSSDIYDHYGDILLAVGNKQEALKQWKKALELDAGNKELLEKVEKLALELQPADTKENTDDK
ncbi:MAG: tetratricopeptide repeat protein [Bacteroidales bacterium]|nr:tetratricopeptide repeat protein [Bacteroidales bacterium]